MPPSVNSRLEAALARSSDHTGARRRVRLTRCSTVPESAGRYRPRPPEAIPRAVLSVPRSRPSIRTLREARRHSGSSRSGKTTLFEILLQGAGSSSPAASGREQIGIVRVPDERVDQLSALFQPKKTTYAQIQFVDSAAAGQRLAAQRPRTRPVRECARLRRDRRGGARLRQRRRTPGVRRRARSRRTRARGRARAQRPRHRRNADRADREGVEDRQAPGRARARAARTLP